MKSYSGVNDNSEESFDSLNRDVAKYVCDKKVCVNADFSVADFLRKTEHLVEISRAPIQSWLPLATLLIDKENTVSKIKNYVKLIKQAILKLILASGACFAIS